MALTNTSWACRAQPPEDFLKDPEAAEITDDDSLSIGDIKRMKAEVSPLCNQAMLGFVYDHLAHGLRPVRWCTIYNAHMRTIRKAIPEEGSVQSSRAKRCYFRTRGT